MQIGGGHCKILTEPYPIDEDCPFYKPDIDGKIRRGIIKQAYKYIDHKNDELREIVKQGEAAAKALKDNKKQLNEIRKW